MVSQSNHDFLMHIYFCGNDVLMKLVELMFIGNLEYATMQ